MINILAIFGAKYLVFFIVLIGGIFFLVQPRWIQKKLFIYAVIALPIIFIIAKLASLIYYDPRPFVVGNFIPLIPHAPDNGFPSDHTLFGTALTVVIFPFNKRIGIILFILAILVGVARVYLQIHHTIDILGSGIISIVVGLSLYYFVIERMYKQKSVQV
jgi:undecaprenyl-diphosphatase